MFRILLFPANPPLARRWLIIAGISSAGSGIASIGAIADRINKIFPAGMILHHFTYMALAIGIICALPLVISRTVLCVSLAQLGVATGLMYLGYSLSGVFQPDYKNVIVVLLCVCALVFAIIFSRGLHFAIEQGAWGDIAVTASFLIIFSGLWLYPIYKTLG